MCAKDARRYAIVPKKLGLKIHLMLCHLISMLITRPLTYWPTEGKNHGWFICVCVIGLAADPSLAIAQFPTSQDLNDFTAVDIGSITPLHVLPAAGERSCSWRTWLGWWSFHYKVDPQLHLMTLHRGSVRAHLFFQQSDHRKWVLAGSQRCS